MAHSRLWFKDKSWVCVAPCGGLKVNTMCSCHHGFRTSSWPLLDIICFLPEFPVMFHWVISREEGVSLTDNTDVCAFFNLFPLMSVYLKKKKMHETMPTRQWQNIAGTVIHHRERIFFQSFCLLSLHCDRVNYFHISVCVIGPTTLIVSHLTATARNGCGPQDIIPKKHFSSQT